jgi:hypothetical protein
MSFQVDHCTEDAHRMAETCRIFADTLKPQERGDFYSALLTDLSDNREFATHQRGLEEYEPVTALAHDMGEIPPHDARLSG